MIWKWGKKYNGWDITGMPLQHFEWVIEHSDNQQHLADANQALNWLRGEGAAYHKPQQAPAPVATPQPPGPPGSGPSNAQQVQSVLGDKGGKTKADPMLLRVLCLIAATLANPKNPWPILDNTIRYSAFGQVPTLAQALKPSTQPPQAPQPATQQPPVPGGVLQPAQSTTPQGNPSGDPGEKDPYLSELDEDEIPF